MGRFQFFIFPPCLFSGVEVTGVGRNFFIFLLQHLNLKNKQTGTHGAARGMVAPELVRELDHELAPELDRGQAFI